ncbi:MAG: hypothetical protein LKE39_01660 [Sphaerochaeta sp.]|nr:hypothetical protein [Sphaerochaeta sp.]
MGCRRDAVFDDTACLYSRSGSFDVQDVVRLLGEHHIVRVSGKDADIRTLGGVMPLRMKPMTLCQLDRNAPLSGFLDPSVVCAAAVFFRHEGKPFAVVGH